MTKESESRNIDFTNGTVVGGAAGERNEDVPGGDALDRLENVIGGAEQPKAWAGDLSRQTARLNAETEEQVDALRVNLTQDNDSMHMKRYGTGKIDDDLAREHIAGVTETGPELADKGVNSVVPGRDDTSSILRSTHPNASVARAQDVVEGNLEEPRDEGRVDRRVDEGTAA